MAPSVEAGHSLTPRTEVPTTFFRWTSTVATSSSSKAILGEDHLCSTCIGSTQFPGTINRKTFGSEPVRIAATLDFESVYSDRQIRNEQTWSEAFEDTHVCRATSHLLQLLLADADNDCPKQLHPRSSSHPVTSRAVTTSYFNSPGLQTPFRT